MKSATSFRLSADALQILKDLSQSTGLSQASVIELALRDMAKKEKKKCNASKPTNTN